MSYLPLVTFLRLGECSQFLLSRSGYAFCSPNEAPEAVNSVTPLTVDTYNSNFLDCVQIRPDATIGRHSMANQWGADVLFRLVCKDEVESNENDSVRKEKAKLYYKYIYLKTIGIEKAVKGEHPQQVIRNLSLDSASEKKILLIDDEAQKGWTVTLKKWLNGADFDVVDKEISSYEDIPDNFRTNIENDYYDLYLLDLRLMGNDEDNIYDTSKFSGMQILRKIKEITEGNQVIMMTASNKAWNMKALLDAGADGYYIKESPELQLPIDFPRNNFESFKADVIHSIEENGNKRKRYRDLNNLINKINSSDKFDEELKNELLASTKLSLKQVMSAKTENDYAYAFVSLFQIIEHICNYFVRPRNEKSQGEEQHWFVNDPTTYLYSYDVKGFVASCTHKEITKKYPSIRERITAVVIAVCNDRNSKFISSIELSINRRNAFVHNDKDALSKEDIARIFTDKGYNELFIVVKRILEGLISSL